MCIVPQGLDVQCGRDSAHESAPIDTQADAKMALDVVFLNSAVDATGAVSTSAHLDSTPLFQLVK